jgi:hypothetical protein
MHAKSNVEPGNYPMTEPEPEEEGDFLIEGNEAIIAGIEIHANIIWEGRKSQIIFTYLPTVRDRKIPRIMTEFNSMLEMLCCKTVTNFPYEGYVRFHTAIRKSGVADRCWYSLKIIAWDDEHDVTHKKIIDWIDPELLHADPHVAFRSKQTMAIMRRGMKEDMSAEGGGVFGS